MLQRPTLIGFDLLTDIHLICHRLSRLLQTARIVSRQVSNNGIAFHNWYSTFRAKPAKTGGLIFITLISFPKFFILFNLIKRFSGVRGITA